MTARRRSIAPVLAALALQLALSLPGSAGLVLCVGTDGHVAVERGACAGEADGAGCDELGAPAPCSDTPLAARELRSAPNARGAEHAVPAALARFSPAPRPASLAVLAERDASFGSGEREHRSRILRL
jgi:hypothetical protein